MLTPDTAQSAPVRIPNPYLPLICQYRVWGKVIRTIGRIVSIDIKCA